MGYAIYSAWSTLLTAVLVVALYFLFTGSGEVFNVGGEPRSTARSCETTIGQYR